MIRVINTDHKFEVDEDGFITSCLTGSHNPLDDVHDYAEEMQMLLNRVKELETNMSSIASWTRELHDEDWREEIIGAIQKLTK